MSIDTSKCQTNYCQQVTTKHNGVIVLKSINYLTFSVLSI